MDFVALVKGLLPIKGNGYLVELVDDPPVAWTDGALVVPLRMTVFEDGKPRDIKEQHVHVLPERHATERGRAFLESACARAATLTAEHVEVLMPYDLFRPELLDSSASIDAFASALDDPRAAQILEKRPEDRALLATIGAPRDVPILRNEALEAGILERPDDPNVYAVYGDWLAERGDPRGELIAMQIAGNTERASELIETYAWEWLRGLAWSSDSEVQIEWKHGFATKVRFGSHDGNAGDDVAWQIRALAEAPGMMFVREVEIMPSHGWDDRAFVAIGEVGLPPRTTTLVIESPEYDHIGDVEPAYPRLASLETLRLTSRSFQLGAIDLPALRSLELVTRGLTIDNIDSLRQGSLPSLERLVLWLGDEGIDECDVEDEDVEWLLAGEYFPKLVHLGLCGRSNAGELVRRIIEAPIVRRLEVLDLADMWLGDEDITFVNASRDKLAHLSAVHLKTRYLQRPIELPNLVADERFIPVYE